VVIKVLFVLLVLCTAALVAVGIAVLLRVRKHIHQEHQEAKLQSGLEKTSEKAEESDKQR